LQLFVEVMQRGSFASAARELGLVTSSVSRAISSLEEELDVRLFQRTARGLKPTEAAIKYHQRVSPVVETLELAGTELRDNNEQPAGVLRITAPTTFGQIAVVPLLKRFTDRYNRLDIRLELSDQVMNLVDDNIDVAIRLGPAEDHRFVTRKIHRIVLRACATPRYLSTAGRPESPEAIRNHNCLLFPFPGFSTGWRFNRPGEEPTEVPVRGNCSISNALALKQCTLMDMGIALLPDWVIARDIQHGRLVDLFPDYEISVTERPLYAHLLYPSCKYVPVKVLVFVNYMLEQFQVCPPWQMDGPARL